MTALLWLRRDLRLSDHPALHAALAAHESVVPVFCLDDQLLHGRHASAPRTRACSCLAGGLQGGEHTRTGVEHRCQHHADASGRQAGIAEMEETKPVNLNRFVPA